MASAKGNDASLDFKEDKVGVESDMDIDEVNAKDLFSRNAWIRNEMWM